MNEHETVGSAPTDQPGPSGSDRMRELLADKRAVALVGVAALAVILVIAFVVVPALTGSSSSSKPSTQGPRFTSQTSASPSASPTVSPSVLPVADQPLKVRNPFSPLAVEGAAAGGGGGNTTGSASATSSPGSTTGSTAPNVSTLRQLTLVEISTPTTAQVTVNGLTYTATLNTKFGDGFMMTAESSGSATFTFNGQTQTLVPGQYAFFSA